nr:hypothetical protein [Arenivirga flava]
MLLSAQRRLRGSWMNRSPAMKRCAIQIGCWWLTITTSPPSASSHASAIAASIRCAMSA